jgi:hypothetical protein
MPDERRFPGIARSGEQEAEGTKVEAGGKLLRYNDLAFVFQALREDLGGLNRAQQGAREDDRGGDAGLADLAGDLPESAPAIRRQVP